MMVLRARNLCLGLLGTILLASGLGARAQVRQVESNLRRPLEPLQTLAGPQSTVESELLAMSEQAGMVFAGQVVAVHRPEVEGIGWVEVEFHVEHAIRGCVDGATYRLREWAGLWAGGAQRYRVGQRLLMLLHAPEASGLSSPVGGQDGAIPIVGVGAAPKPGDGSVVVGQQSVDLRWVEARLLRSSANGGRLHARPVRPVSQEPQERPQALQVAIQAGDVDSSSTEAAEDSRSLQEVLAMLRAGEAQQANAAQ